MAQNVEERIVELLRQDDPAALDTIYDLYGTRLFGYIAAIIGRTHDAEDVLQELFARIARKRRQLAQARDLEAYLIEKYLSKFRVKKAGRKSSGKGFIQGQVGLGNKPFLWIYPHHAKHALAEMGHCRRFINYRQRCG
jgi:hypothetical protein